MIKKFIIIPFIAFFIISCTTLTMAGDSKQESGTQLAADNVTDKEELTDSDELALDSEGLSDNAEMAADSDEAEVLIAEIESQADKSEELITEIADEMPVDDTREQIAELREKIDELTEMIAMLLEQSRTAAPVQQPTPAPVPLVQPPVTAQPPAPIPPPASIPPLAQITIEEITVDEEVTEEDEVEEEPPPVRTVYVPELLPSPSTRIESLTQMGTTPLDTEINFSRIVRATVGQVLEIPFRGNGWVYLGELASRRGIVYNSRRSDPEGLSFIFSCEEPGTYALKFYRQDFIRDFILNDHVQVIVGEAPAAGTGWFNPQFDRGRVVAQPRWPSAVEEAQIRSGTSSVTPAQETPPAAVTPAAITPPAAAQTTITPADTASAAVSTTVTPTITEPQVTETVQEVKPARPRIPGTEGLSGDAVIQRAQNAFEGGNTASAIALLDQYMLDYPGGSDEVYWMYGQFYESNTPARNILLSMEYYRRLMNEYPQSRRFNDARRRVAYLERFYINIQ